MASYEAVVERGKIREYATATLSEEPAYDGGERCVSPPTYLWLVNKLWPPSGGDQGGGIGLDPARVLHAEEEFVFHGEPPRAGDVLAVTTQVGEPFEKTGAKGGRLRFVVITQQYTDQAGRLVAEERTTLVETGQAPVSGDGS